MKIIMSIKPIYADKIFKGAKRFEYRRSIFKDNSVKKVIVYSSSPVCRIIGHFTIDHIIHDSPEAIWQLTNNFSGIVKSDFDLYFKNKSLGYALVISEPFLYPLDLPLISMYNSRPPQSFAYIS